MLFYNKYYYLGTVMKPDTDAVQGSEDPNATTPVPKDMAPIETMLPYGVPSAQDEGMAEGYMTMVDNFSDMPKDIVKTYKDRLGRDREAKEIPWETRYPLGPQQRDDSAGLADRQWIDPHPLANNVDLP